MADEIKEFGDFYSKEILKKKKVQWVFALIIFAVILFVSVNIRLSNVDKLIDRTTGEYTTNDLDSLYFYRQAETQLELGRLPEIDEMRSPGRNTKWIPELIDNYLVWNYKILKLFSPSISFNYAATISAPIFFAIGLVLFFILCFLLTKSKAAALFSSAFLAFAPGFLFRSIAGFYDHDHVGVFALFVLVIFAFIGLSKFEKNYKNVLWGVAVGFSTALVLASWGGATTFVLVFFPVACFIYFIFNNKNKKQFILFYLLWILSSVIFTPLLGSKAIYMYARFLQSQGILVLFVLLYAIVDLLFEKFHHKIKFIQKKDYYKWTFGLTSVVGVVGLVAIGKNPFSMFRSAWATLIYPFFGEFGGRLSATVAENAQPYLTELINQNGKILFWLFILGLVLVSINLGKNSVKIKHKIIVASSVFFMFFAILFSRYSSNSIFNGENFASQVFYLLGIIAFLVGVAYVYSKEKFKINAEEIILFGIAITTVMNARAAVRSFFLITPFIALIAGYGIVELWKKYKSSNDETLKLVLIIATIFAVILAGYSIYEKYNTVSVQAKYVGPSANHQWQNAMQWVRQNTDERDIFVHWWDYGYFVQTLGKRPTVTDGGHSGGNDAIHYIGRYILTTPNPATAYSFMKTWNVSYLLIDPTEMGKYGAFSKIGSNDSWDRVSAGIFGGVADEKATQETANGITKVYQLGGCVDEEISYTDNNTRILIPGISVTKQQRLICNSYVAGVILEFEFADNKTSIKQPTGVFVYNNRQYRVPLKHVFYNGEMLSFEKGIDSVVYLIPKVNEQTGTVDQTGAMIYLSPRTFNSLMGKLYVLNDPYDEYDDLTLAYKIDDSGGQLNEFFWYNGLRAPLKIWEVNYPAGTPVYEEFFDQKGFSVNGEGWLDYLFG